MHPFDDGNVVRSQTLRPGLVGLPCEQCDPAFPIELSKEATSVSGIWTPSGEHIVPDDGPHGVVDLANLGGVPVQGPSGGLSGGYPADPGGDGGGQFGPDISPEEVAAMRQIHNQIRSTPAIDVVANHGVQLFELALVYLGVATPPDDQGRVPMPDLTEAGVAIDAMAALIDGMGQRLGEHEQTLRDGLAQIQQVYVQIADQLNEQFGEGG